MKSQFSKQFKNKELNQYPHIEQPSSKILVTKDTFNSSSTQRVKNNAIAACSDNQHSLPMPTVSFLKEELAEAQKTIQRQESQLNFVRESHKQTVSLLGKQSQEFLNLEKEHSSLQKYIKSHVQELQKSNDYLHSVIARLTNEMAILKQTTEQNAIKPLVQEIAHSEIIETPPLEVDFDEIQTVPSVIVLNNSLHASQEQGEPILNEQEQPILEGEEVQLMGGSSHDFSIIDHQD